MNNKNNQYLLHIWDIYIMYTEINSKTTDLRLVQMQLLKNRKLRGVLKYSNIGL